MRIWLSAIGGIAVLAFLLTGFGKHDTAPSNLLAGFTPRAASAAQPDPSASAFAVPTTTDGGSSSSESGVVAPSSGAIGHWPPPSSVIVDGQPLVPPQQDPRAGEHWSPSEPPAEAQASSPATAPSSGSAATAPAPSFGAPMLDPQPSR